MVLSDTTISRLISLQAARDPDRPAITFEGCTVTRDELDRRTNRLARAYARLAYLDWGNGS